MKFFVIDACVAVKWGIAEKYHEAALQFLQDDIRLLAPSLFIIECASAIQNHVRIGELTDEDGWEAFKTICSFESLSLTSSKELIHRSYSIANELNHALYDCLYLALAEKQNISFVTADVRFFNRVQKSNYNYLIKWIEEPI